MKTCAQFHIEDLEYGDKIELIEDALDPAPIRITVGRLFQTNRFGPVIRSSDFKEYYVYDYDIIRLVEVTA